LVAVQASLSSDAPVLVELDVAVLALELVALDPLEFVESVDDWAESL
jgi:hypothetical protein